MVRIIQLDGRARVVEPGSYKPTTELIDASLIGSWGTDIIFRVSRRSVLTFNNLSRTVSNRWATHTPVFGKPVKEFLGAELDQITLTIVLNASMNISVRSMIENLEKAVEEGRVNYLIIGGKKLCKNKCYIAKMSEAWDTVHMQGRLYEAKLNLTFSEYT